MCSHVSTRVSPIGFFVAIVGVNVCYAYIGAVLNVWLKHNLFRGKGLGVAYTSD